jgi:hypothetical protein
VNKSPGRFESVPIARSSRALNRVPVPTEQGAGQTSGSPGCTNVAPPSAGGGAVGLLNWIGVEQLERPASKQPINTFDVHAPMLPTSMGHVPTASRTS